jgi:hypothetical protein|nr:MAG TPA: hypothetical protein [Caudoviricetes sp.]
MKDIQFYLNGYLKDEKKIYSWTITSKQVQQLIKLQEKVKKTGGFVVAKGSTYYGEQVTFAPTEVTTEPKEKNFYTTLDADKIFWVVDIYIEKDEKFRIEVPLSKAEKQKRKEEEAEENMKKWEELKLEEDVVPILSKFFNSVATTTDNGNKGIYLDNLARTSLSSLIYTGGSIKQEVSLYLDYSKKHLPMETLGKILYAWSGVESFRTHVEKIKGTLLRNYCLTFQATYSITDVTPTLRIRIGYASNVGFGIVEACKVEDNNYARRLKNGEVLRFEAYYPKGVQSTALTAVHELVSLLIDFIDNLEESGYPRFAQVLEEARKEAYELGIYRYAGVSAYEHPELSSSDPMDELVK